MRARNLLALAAMSAALAATAVPAFAQNAYPPPAQGQIHPDAYCAQVRQNRMMIGGAIGAAVGAVLGNNLAARNAQTEGSVLGGVAGAATGAVIGRNTGNCSARAQQQAGYNNGYGYQQPAYGYGQPAPQPYPTQTGYGDRYPLAGGPSAGASSCRWGTMTTRDPDGREVRESVYMCRGPDGVWRAQQ